MKKTRRLFRKSLSWVVTVSITALGFYGVLPFAPALLTSADTQTSVTYNVPTDLSDSSKNLLLNNVSYTVSITDTASVITQNGGDQTENVTISQPGNLTDGNATANAILASRNPISTPEGTYYPRYTDIQKNLRPEGEFYTDITFTLPARANLDRFFISHHSSTVLMTYKYTVYIAESPDGLYLESNRAFTYTNLGDQFQTHSFSGITGRYVGVRILAGVQPAFTTSNWDWSYAYVRLFQIAAFGEYYHVESDSPANSTADDEAVATGDNLLYGRQPYTVAVTDNGVGYNTALFTAINNQVDNMVLTDGINYPYGMIHATGHEYVDSNGVLRDDGSIYTDVVYGLSGVAKVNEVWIYHHSNTQITTYKYEIYISEHIEDLYNEESFVLSYVNTSLSRRQRFTFYDNPLAQYMGVRITMAVSPSFSMGKSAAYARLGEIALFGDYYTVASDSPVNSTAADEEVAIENNLLYGLQPQSVKVTDNGVGYNTSLCTAIGNQVNNTVLTDGINYPYGIVHASGHEYVNPDGTLREDGSIYTDITYQLTDRIRANEVWIYHHSNTQITTYHYEIYISDSLSSLYTQESRVLSFVNSGTARRQKFHFYNKPIGQYVGVRIWMAVSPSFSMVYSEAYARLGEIALFGEQPNQSISVNSTVQGVDDTTGNPGIVTASANAAFYGDSVSFAAQPVNSYYQFVRWIDANTGETVSQTASFTKTITSPVSYTAIFQTSSTITDKLYFNFDPTVQQDYLTSQYGNLLYGLPIHSLNVTDNDVQYSATLKSSLTNSTNNYVLTDGINYPYGMLQASGHSYVDANRNLRDDGSIYTDIVYELNNTVQMKSLWIYHHFIKSITTYRYAVYVSDTESALFSDFSWVLTCQNTELYPYQIINLQDLNVTGKYLGVRMLMGVSQDYKTSDNAIDWAFVRLGEIALYGDYADAAYNREQENEIQDSAQMTGNEATGADRAINVDVNDVISEDYMSHGTNIFPMNLFDESKAATGYNDVYFEIDADRFTKIAPNMGRMWFQMDWMTTANESDYLNGVYNFQSQQMQSVYKYLDLFQSIGTEIELNFGWKVGTGIQSWFGIPGVTEPRNAAPKDLDAYARACSACLHELIVVRGYTCIKYLTFYNEPNNGSDFATGTTNQMAYWVEMVRKVDAQLRMDGLRDAVDILGMEQAVVRHQITPTTYLMNNGSSYVDGYSVHHYYDYALNYQTAFKTFQYLMSAFNKPTYITEMYGMKYGSATATGVWNGWEDSYTSYLVATANTGMKGFLTWSMVGSWMPNPLSWALDGDKSCWAIPKSQTSVDRVYLNYYEQSLLTNYVPAHSDVLSVDWYGQDIRTSALRHPDGNYTVVVEANNADSARNLTINFSQSIGKTFHKFAFIPATQAVNNNALVPACQGSLPVQSTLTDTLGSAYGVYIYTTADPIKQIAINSVQTTCTAGGSVQLGAQLIDCVPGDTVNWSVSAATGLQGGVSASGLYTAPSNAVPGSMIAVRASLASDPRIFAVSIIRIT